MTLPPRFRPMLASKAPSKIKFPVYVSPKLDGIRCILCGGRAYTRSLKRIPNHYIRQQVESFSAQYPDDLFDGEILVGKNFQDTSSAVMSEEDYPEFKFAVFDVVPSLNFKSPFFHRLNVLRTFFSQVHSPPSWLRSVHYEIDSDETDLDCSLNFLGGEGVICRSPDGPYKFGRSTPNEGYMWKIKHWADAEALVIGATELMHNANPAGVSELGLTERSSAQAGQYPSGMMGTLVCRGLNLPFKDVVFEIGTGFTQVQRECFWPAEKVKGQIVKFKYQDFGIKDKPRSPVFLGFRDSSDL